MAKKYMYFLNEERKKVNILKKIIPVLIIFFLLFTSFVVNRISLKNTAVQSIVHDSDYLGTLQNEVFIAEEKRKQEEALLKAQQNRFRNLSSEELEMINHIYAHKEEKKVFLTFDDGPTSNITPQILDILKRYNVKATFFVLGKQVERNPDLIKREFNEGHSIESHTYSHSYKTVYQSKDSFFDEFNRTEAALQRTLNRSDFKTLVVRMPGGSVGGQYSAIKKEIGVELTNKGIASLDWNVLTKDAEGASQYDEIINNIVTGTGNKHCAVVLMHDADTKQITADTLPKVIEYYRDNGFKFETIEDYIGRT